MINNIKNVSVLSVLSLIVSVVALALYVAIFESRDAFIPWLIMSVLAVILPFVSKYFRNRYDKTGKSVEITAFVIGAFDLYCVFFAATKINIYIVFLIIAIISILYAKLFNYVMAVPKRKDTENDSAKKIKMTNFPMFLCIVSCACTIFLTIDALITTGELDNYGNWFAIFVLYCLPLILFNINRKKNKRSLAIFLFVVMILFMIGIIALSVEEYSYDFSLEACFAFSILCISTFIQFIFSIVQLVKICADKYYGSIRYRERCYKRVEKMRGYMERGIISEEEFEKNKQDILKRIRT